MPLPIPEKGLPDLPKEPNLKDLSKEAAEVLLREIIRATPDAGNRGAEYVMNMANAYATVVSNMPADAPPVLPKKLR